MPADLLLELGCEEIPAKMLSRALAELPAMITARLAEARLPHGEIVALGTPRRLALVVRGLADRQPDLRERVVGPPVSAGFAPDGTPTKAAIGFAQKNGVDPASLERAPVEGKKGEYVVATRHVAGQDAAAVLVPLIEGLIPALPWPKSMRWAFGEATFVRPMHWIVCLLGGEVLPVRFAGLRAGRATRGHRFLAPDAIDLAGADAYAPALQRAFVIADPAARRDLVIAELRRVEAESGLRVRMDEGLLAEVTNLVEYPVAVMGTFDPAYLEVPEEVIVTAIRNHQRYFAMEERDGDHRGALAPRFVTIAGTIVRQPAVVAAGNERAVRPRLADAQFFFREDRKKALAEHGRALDDVVFLAKLGTVGAKVARVARLAEGVGAAVGLDRTLVRRAAELAKADLSTGVVGEFPELQGIMGGHYARLAGEPEAVWRAIPDHYRPRGASDAPPESDVGAALAIADRLDTIVGCFAIDQEPTGSADPLGLRRAAIGVLSILLERGPGGARFDDGGPWRHLRVDRLIDDARDVLEASGVAVKPEDVGEVREFFRGRLRGLLLDEGLQPQDVDAALGAGWSDVCDARIRARDLAVVPAEARAVFKRISNILDDAAMKGIAAAGGVRPELFAAPDNVEHRLLRAFHGIEQVLDAAVAAHDYRRVFGLLVELQPAVAAFFDKGGVMVMDPDPALRDNRLALLGKVIAPFAKVADFRALAAAGGAS